MSALPRALRKERSRWERLARDPYYAVINADDNRADRLTAEGKQALADSGERDVAQTVDEVRRWVAPDFGPQDAVDFGCGVGRLTIPLSRFCGRVIGVDISDVMLTEARRNCVDVGVKNATFVLSAEYFGRSAAESVDFVHAYIVMQHIPPKTGLWITRELIARLRPGGVGALHFTYDRRASRVRRAVNALRRRVTPVNSFVNIVQGRPVSEPFIPMFRYDLGTVYRLLAESGCCEVHSRLTDHGGHLGAMMVFRKGQERVDR